MKRVGAHVSAAGGVQNAPLNAMEIGAKAFAMFTKNQRQWFSKDLTENEIKEFKQNMEKCGFLPENVLAHDGYLINLGNPTPENREKSLNSFIDEIKRCEALGIKYLNFHPGTSLGEISDEECLSLIADGINAAINKTNETILVIENTAGQGSNVGYKFEHLAYIIERIENKNRIGVCLDTCHTFASGYDIRSEEGYIKTMDEFEKIVGFKYLKGMHINDSKSDLGSRVDRHDSIGKGKLGTRVFELIMNDSRMEEIPLILETVDPDLWPEEIKMLYSFVGGFDFVNISK